MKNEFHEDEIGLHLKENVIPQARTQPPPSDDSIEGECLRYAVSTAIQVWRRNQQVDEGVAVGDLLPYLSTDHLLHIERTASAFELLEYLDDHPVTTEDVFRQVDEEFLQGLRLNRKIPQHAPRFLVEEFEELVADEVELSVDTHAQLSEILRRGGCFIGTLQLHRKDRDLISKSVYKLCEGPPTFGDDDDDDDDDDKKSEDDKIMYHSVCVVGEWGKDVDGYYIYLNSYGTAFGDKGLGRIGKRCLVEAFPIKPLML